MTTLLIFVGTIQCLSATSISAFTRIWLWVLRMLLSNYLGPEQFRSFGESRQPPMESGTLTVRLNSNFSSTSRIRISSKEKMQRRLWPSWSIKPDWPSLQQNAPRVFERKTYHFSHITAGWLLHHTCHMPSVMDAARGRVTPSLHGRRHENGSGHWWPRRFVFLWKISVCVWDWLAWLQLWKILTPPRHQRILLQAHFCALQGFYIRDIAAWRMSHFLHSENSTNNMQNGMGPMLGL